MMFTQQVLHVARKDLRQLAGLIGIYLLLVAIATGHALRNYADERTFFVMVPLLVVIVGIVIAASMVQGDSPTRSVAFWTSRPLDPRAVLCGKAGLVAVLVAGTPLVAQSICLMVYGLPIAQQMALLGSSLASYSMLLLLAMVGAALTRDLRTLVVAAIVGFIGMSILAQQMVMSAIPRLPWWASGLTTVLGSAAAIALLVHVYWSRDFRLRTKVAGAALVMIVFVGTTAPRVARYETPRSQPVLSATSSGTLGVTLLPRSANVHDRPQLSFAMVGGAPSERWRLVDPMVTFHLGSGRTIRVPFDSRVIQLVGPNAFLAHGYQRADHEFIDESRTGVVTKPSAEETIALAGLITRVEIEGQLEVWKSEMEGQLPLEAGAALDSRGTRVRIAHVERMPTSVHLEVVGSSPPGDAQRADENFPGEYSNSQFALLNDARHEIAALEPGATSSSNAPMVIPGITINTFSRELSTRSDERAQLSPEWVTNAKLAIMRWTLRGTRPLHATVSMPATP